MKNPGLGFGALGPLLMTTDGTRVPLGAAKQRAVLAMLPVLACMTVLAVLALVQLVNLWRRAPQASLAHVQAE